MDGRDADAAGWDVFLSYSRGDDAAPARTLADALQGHGLRVFWDDHDIQPFQGISRSILLALGRSKVLLTYFSANYPRRRACQYELTAAFLAGQQEGDPTRRVLVVNPEPGRDHIDPLQLRDARHARAPKSRRDLEQLASQISAHVRTIGTEIGQIEPLAAPPLWLPVPARPRPIRSVERITELWDLHSALHPFDAALTSEPNQPIAVVVGPAGVGKNRSRYRVRTPLRSGIPGRHLLARRQWRRSTASHQAAAVRDSRGVGWPPGAAKRRHCYRCRTAQPRRQVIVGPGRCPPRARRLGRHRWPGSASIGAYDYHHPRPTLCPSRRPGRSSTRAAPGIGTERTFRQRSGTCDRLAATS